MKLTDVIAIWDILHVKDIGYCDLLKAIEEVIGVENDVCSNTITPEVSSRLANRPEGLVAKHTQTQNP